MILDETLDNYYNNETKRAKYRGLTTGNTGRSKSTVRWIYGIPCILPDSTGKYPCKWNAIRTAGGSILPVQPSTITEYTGCTDCKGTEIYEGDIVIKNKSYVRWIQYNERHACYTTMRRGGMGDYFCEYLAKGDAYCRNLEVVGNVWENPNLTKRKSIVMGTEEFV